MSMAFEVGKRVVAESESITVDPGQVSLRRCCEAIPRLATGSAGTTATRACTRPRAAPFEPNNGRRSRSERQPENAEQPEPAIDRTRPGDEPPLRRRPLLLGARSRCRKVEIGLSWLLRGGGEAARRAEGRTPGCCPRRALGPASVGLSLRSRCTSAARDALVRVGCVYSGRGLAR